MDKLKLKEQAEKLLEIHREISGFYNEYAKSMGATLAGLEVLLIIWNEKVCTQKTIVQKTFLPKQTVSAIIQKLKTKNIVEVKLETASDKRNKEIKFTELGKKLADKFIPIMKEAEYRALDALGEAKREILIEIITEYKNNLSIE